jgi:hypothetical protein
MRRMASFVPFLLYTTLFVKSGGKDMRRFEKGANLGQVFFKKTAGALRKPRKAPASSHSKLKTRNSKLLVPPLF